MSHSCRRPFANQLVGGAGVTAPLTATVSGVAAGDAIAKVEFWWGTNPPMATISTAPYTMQWSLDPRWTPAGTYSLMAKVTTISGATATSPVLTVQVVASVSFLSPTPGAVLGRAVGEDESALSRTLTRRTWTMARVEGVDLKQVSNDYTAKIFPARAPAWGAPLLDHLV